MPRTETLEPTTKPKQRIVSIQVCRGIAAMIVVLAHLHNLEEKYFSTDLLRIFQFGVLGVDLFFVISGVVISAVCLGKAPGIETAGMFLYHRFARIYPVFWIYSFVVLAAFLYNPLWINAAAGHRVDILPSFFLVPTHLPMLVMQGWTLSSEIYFYFIFFALLLLPDRVRPWLLGAWAAAVALFAALEPAPAQPVLALMVHPLMLEFLAGCVLFQLYRRSRLKPGIGLALIAAATLWLVCIVIWTARFHHFDQVWIERSRWVRPTLYGSFATLFVFGAMELERTNIIRFSGFFADLGDWSYSIYLSHIILIELCGRTVIHYAAHLPLAILFVTGVTLPATVVAGYLSYTWIERPLIRMLYKPSRRAVTGGVPREVEAGR